MCQAFFKFFINIILFYLYKSPVNWILLFLFTNEENEI